MVNIHTKKVYRHCLKLDKGFKFAELNDEYLDIFDEGEMSTFKFSESRTLLTWYSENDYTEITDKGWEGFCKYITVTSSVW